MKNITVSLDDETYRRGRLYAAEQGRSLSAIVREFLTKLGSGETEFGRLVREERRFVRVLESTPVRTGPVGTMFTIAR